MSHPQPSEAWSAPGVCGTAATERVSLDQAKVLMKWDGPTPQYFAGVTTYTHTEIIKVLSEPEWSQPRPEEPAS